MDPRIIIFYRQYLQQVAVTELSYPPDKVLLDPSIQSQMCQHMFSQRDPVALWLPPAAYQRLVLKNVTGRIEAAISDPDEDVGSNALA